MKRHLCSVCGKKLTCKSKERIGPIIMKHEIACKEEERRKREEIEKKYQNE